MDSQESAPAEITVIRTYFAKLGLDQALADMYHSLHTHGPQNISQLARTSRVERTRIYRLLDQLMESNLVELEVASSRGIIKAAPIANLRILINQRQEALKNLGDELELIEQTFARNSLSNPAIRIQTYIGQNGLDQVLWNLITAGQGQAGPLTLYTHLPQPLEKLPSKSQAATWQQSFTALAQSNNIIHHVLPTTDALPLPAHFILYGPVIAYLEWRATTFYGTELHNHHIADLHRQLLSVV